MPAATPLPPPPTRATLHARHPNAGSVAGEGRHPPAHGRPRRRRGGPPPRPPSAAAANPPPRRRSLRAGGLASAGRPEAGRRQPCSPPLRRRPRRRRCRRRRSLRPAAVTARSARDPGAVCDGRRGHRRAQLPRSHRQVGGVQPRTRGPFLCSPLTPRPSPFDKGAVSPTRPRLCPCCCASRSREAVATRCPQRGRGEGGLRGEREGRLPQDDDGDSGLLRGRR